MTKTFCEYHKKRIKTGKNIIVFVKKTQFFNTLTFRSSAPSRFEPLNKGLFYFRA